MGVMDGLRNGYGALNVLSGAPGAINDMTQNALSGLRRKMSGANVIAPETGEAQIPTSTTASPTLSSGAPNNANPNVPAGGQSPEAAAYQQSRAVPAAEPAVAANDPVGRSGLRATPAGIGGKLISAVGAGSTAVNGARQMYDGYKESQVLDNPVDAAALAGERVSRLTGAELGGMGGAALGARGGPIGSLAGGAIGGAAGYFAPDAVKKITDTVGLTDPNTLLPSQKADAIIASQQQAPAVNAQPVSLRAGSNSNLTTTAPPTVDSLRSQPDNTQFFAAGTAGARSAINEQNNGLRTLPAAGTGIMTDSHGNAVRFAPGSDDQQPTLRAAPVYAQQPAYAPQADPVAEATAAAAKAQKGGNLDDIIASRVGLRAAQQAAAQRADLQKANIAADTTRYGVDVQAGTQRSIARSQRAFEAAKFGIEQSNKDREFGLQADQADQAARQTSQKALNDQLGTIFTTKDDKGNVVPDNSRVADASQKIEEELGARVQDLRKVPESDPNYAQAQHLAHQIEKKGTAALGPDDMRELLSQAAIRDRVLQAKSALPGGAAPVDSRLSGYRLKNKDSNLVGSDTLELANGTRVRANDLRYTDPANAVLPDLFKTPTDEYAAGLRSRGQ